MKPAKNNAVMEQVLTKLNEPVRSNDALHQWKTEMHSLINTLGDLKLSSSTVEVADRCSSLDPSDWLSARCLAHKMLDSALSFMEQVRDRPVWQPVPVNVKEILEMDPLPENGQPLRKLCEDVVTYILPYSLGNTHPRFWGWVLGEGTLAGVLGDMIAATMNPNCGGLTHSSVFVERAVIHWMRELFHFPPASGGGLLVTGTMMATVTSFAVARQRALAGEDQNKDIDLTRLVVYASTETHVCVPKALKLLGFSSEAIHYVPVDDNFSIKIDELKNAIRSDRDQGLIPFAVVGNVGTVNTGAFDDLLAISSIARSENIWFHTDGAFGSLIILDPERQRLVVGIEQSDSIAFDFHKWLHCPYDAGCALIRDEGLLQRTFSNLPSYLTTFQRGCAVDTPEFAHSGPELSRSFRALKVWLTLKEHGTKKLGQKIADNCTQAQYLVSLLEKCHPSVHIIRPVLLNIVNFRFVPSELNDTNPETIDMFNRELAADIQLSGTAVTSTTRIHKSLYLRVAIVSHRATFDDFDIFVTTLLQLYQTRLKMHLNQEN